MVRSVEDLYEDGKQSDEGADASDSQGAASTQDGTSREDVQAQSPDEGDPEDLTGLKRSLAASRDDTKAERKARREAEQRLAEYERRLAALESQGQGKPKQIGPEDLENQFFEKPGQFFMTLKQELQQEMQQQAWAINAKASERRVRRENDDYDEAEKAFFESSRQRPWLMKEVYASDDPAEIILQEGRRLLGKQDTPEVQRLRAEVEALKAQQGQVTVQAHTRQHIPKSNAGARGSSVGVKGKWSGPRTAEQLYDT